MLALVIPEVVKSSGACWDLRDQYIQLLTHQHRTVAHLQQHICELGSLVVDLEAWKHNAQRQMSELQAENADLQLKLLAAQHFPAQIDCDAAQKFEASPPGLTAICPQAPTVLEVDAEESQGKRGISPVRPQADGIAACADGMPACIVSPERPRDDGIAACADGITTCSSFIGGKASIKVQWRIGRFSSQLSGAMGRALVSPAFDVGGLTGLRLMAASELQGSLLPRRSSGKSARQAHKQLATEGPVDACLMLKVPNAPDCHVEYFVSVGGHTQGPFFTNFSAQCLATHSRFGIDWLQERGSGGSILVGVEIVQPEWRVGIGGDAKITESESSPK